MKYIFLHLFIVILFIGCNVEGTGDSSKLTAPTGDKIYFGAFPDFGGSEDVVTTERLDDFSNLIGKKPYWAYFSQNWYNGIKYPQNAINTIRAKGVIPFLRIMPRSGDEQYKKESEFSLSNIIDGKFDKEIREFAKATKNDSKKLLIDFAVEPNGDWFGWSGAYNGKDSKDLYGDKEYFDGAERYRDAYRHIIDIFKEEKVNNVTWFFHVDIYSNPDEEWNIAKLYYPGDDYIDWIGVSIYGAQNSSEDYWDSFSNILEERANTIRDISSTKPIALLEFGVTDNNPLGDKSEWLKDAFETILSGNYIKFKAISYWHETWNEDGAEYSLRIDSSSESLDMFKNYVNNDSFIFSK